MCEPMLSVLLYGNTELSYEQNKEIFLSVQNYIVKSQRFQIQVGRCEVGGGRIVKVVWSGGGGWGCSRR